MQSVIAPHPKRSPMPRTPEMPWQMVVPSRRESDSRCRWAPCEARWEPGEPQWRQHGEHESDTICGGSNSQRDDDSGHDPRGTR
jgi:hypothetical protein